MIFAANLTFLSLYDDSGRLDKARRLDKAGHTSFHVTKGFYHVKQA